MPKICTSCRFYSPRGNFNSGTCVTKTEIARRLGYKTHALQLNRHRITARNAMKIERLYRQVRAGDPEFEDVASGGSR